MKPRGRPGDREHKLAVNAALDFLGVPTTIRNEIKPPRARAARATGTPAGPPLEKKVLADVLSALRGDPRVAAVWRQQSGLFKDGDRYIRVGAVGVLDVSGMLRGGQYFEIECKREGQFPDEAQWKRIYLIRNAGGIAGCAHNAAEALEILQ